jgi:2-haloacid dehalogenase
VLTWRGRGPPTRESPINPVDRHFNSSKLASKGSSITLTRRELLATTAAATAINATRGRSARAEAAGGEIKAVGFDAFTIFDPRSVAVAVEESFPGRGAEVSAAWRTRQFEYCWLRTLNRNYADFWRVTEDALVFACKAAKLDLKPDTRAKLTDAFLRLKPWPDSIAALKAMRAANIRLAYVSNMTPTMLKALTESAGAADLFEHQLSTDAVKAFKPDPRAYQMAETAFNLPRENIVFAAFGGWDAAGGRSFGFNTFWVNRSGAPLEELGVEPNAVGGTLTELAKYVTG